MIAAARGALMFFLLLIKGRHCGSVVSIIFLLVSIAIAVGTVPVRANVFLLRQFPVFLPLQIDAETKFADMTFSKNVIVVYHSIDKPSIVGVWIIEDGPNKHVKIVVVDFGLRPDSSVFYNRFAGSRVSNVSLNILGGVDGSLDHSIILCGNLISVYVLTSAWTKDIYYYISRACVASIFDNRCENMHRVFAVAFIYNLPMTEISYVNKRPLYAFKGFSHSIISFVKYTILNENQYSSYGDRRERPFLNRFFFFILSVILFPVGHLFNSIGIDHLSEPVKSTGYFLLAAVTIGTAMFSLLFGAFWI